MTKLDKRVRQLEARNGEMKVIFVRYEEGNRPDMDAEIERQAPGVPREDVIVISTMFEKRKSI